MTVLPNHASMKANTASAFVSAGLALAMALRPSSLSVACSRMLAALTAAWGALTLLEYSLHLDLHIDQLIFPDPYQHPYPGRMAHITAANFCLSGLALALLRGSRRARLLALLAAVLLTFNAFAAVVGALYGVPFFYGQMGYTAMALHTGIGFLVLGTGLLLAQSDSALVRILLARQAGGWVARRLLPGVVLLPVVLGGIFLRADVDLGRPQFGMALLAVTLVATGGAALLLIAFLLNLQELEQHAAVRERERSAAEIRQSERELRLVTDHLPTLVSYIDKDGRFLRVNRTYQLWSGLPPEKIVGRTVREIVGEEYWRVTAAARESALAGETTTVETTYPTLQGGRVAQVTYAPDIDEQGQVRGMVCMVADVEDQRQAEAALRQSEKLAVVGRLASAIAHEINNPLEAVTNLIYLAALETQQQPSAARYLEQAQQELARAAQIVSQTLRFHRQASQPTLCRMSEIIEQVLVLYHGRIGNAGIEVQGRFRDQDAVLCKEGEVRQVLANLIGNAADAMSTGGKLMVRTRPATDPRTGQHGVVITVADTGHGIKPEMKSTLFEPFHTTKGERGSGLGLWVSKEIVDRHGGVMRVRSSVDPSSHGTIFSTFLPHLQTGPQPPLASASR